MAVNLGLKRDTKVAVIRLRNMLMGTLRHAPNGTPVGVGKSENINDGQIVTNLLEGYLWI
jgi:hypothetical protein